MQLSLIVYGFTYIFFVRYLFTAFSSLVSLVVVYLSCCFVMVRTERLMHVHVLCVRAHRIHAWTMFVISLSLFDTLNKFQAPLLKFICSVLDLVSQTKATNSEQHLLWTIYVWYDPAGHTIWIIENIWRVNRFTEILHTENLQQPKQIADPEKTEWTNRVRNSVKCVFF